MATSKLAALAALCLAACATHSAERLTAPAPLLRPDGVQLEAAELAAASRATVLIWWSSTCPCVARYEARVQALAERHPELAFYYVASNADETASSLARRSPIPILRDPKGQLAAQLGVRSTPTALVLAPDGQVLFHGWIDNERQPGETGREPWLELALSRFAAGDRQPTRAPTWGCMITRSL